MQTARFSHDKAVAIETDARVFMWRHKDAEQSDRSKVTTTRQLKCGNSHVSWVTSH
jgi:hypothetical protein